MSWTVRLSGVALGAIILCGQAFAEPRTVIVPLDAFAGTYVAAPKQDESRTAYVAYERPAQVTGARLHLVGTAVPAELDCTPGGSGDPGVNFNVWVAYPGTGDYRWAFSTSLGDLTTFDFVEDLVSLDRNDVLAILASGHFDIRLWSSPGFMSDCGFILPFPTATVTADTLLIDAEYTVPAVGTAWGAVQAAFR